MEVPVAVRLPLIPDEKKREELGITLRELEILERIAQGMSNREIAEALCEREHGENPLHRVFDKLGAKRLIAL